MPITKQVIKRVKQAQKKADRNRHYRSHMKSMIKLIFQYVAKKESDKATKILPKVIHSIDTCAKKKIIHRNNAAHKKSRLQRALNALMGTGKAPAKGSETIEEIKKEEAPSAA